MCFVRRTLARSAFHGFSIGFQRCRSVQKVLEWLKLVDLSQEFSNDYLPSSIIHLQKSASIQPRTGLSKFAKK